MPDPTYRVRDWSRHYENSDSRKTPLKHFDWVKLPVKLEGRGYLKLALGKDGASHFGVWCALLQLAATCRPRGTLCHGDGEPMTLHDIHLRLRFPMAVLETALTHLTAIGWVETLPATPGDSRALPATPSDSVLDKTETETEKEIPSVDARSGRKRPSRATPEGLEHKACMEAVWEGHRAVFGTDPSGGAHWAKVVANLRAKGAKPDQFRRASENFAVQVKGSNGFIPFAPSKFEPRFWGLLNGRDAMHDEWGERPEALGPRS